MYADGSSQGNLTNHPAQDTLPAWSPRRQLDRLHQRPGWQPGDLYHEEQWGGCFQPDAKPGPGPVSGLAVSGYLTI